MNEATTQPQEGAKTIIEINEEPQEVLEVDQQEDDDDEGVDEEQLEEYREKVLELGRFAVSRGCHPWSSVTRTSFSFMFDLSQNRRTRLPSIVCR